MMKKISILIVNYNTHEYLRNCIRSIKLYCNIDYEIIIIDNNSSDKRIYNLQKEFNDINFIFHKENIGFGSGCNYCANIANGEYFLFLNPDIEIKENSIQKLVNYYDSNANIGVLSGILTDDNNLRLYSFNSFPNLNWEFREAYGIFIKKEIDRLLNRKEIINKTPFEVDWFHGACLLISRIVFNKVKGFDDKYFLYYEDTDLQLRIKNLGYKIMCIPESEFYHIGKSSIKEKDVNTVYHLNMHLSKLYFYKKHNSQFKVFIVRILYISGSVVKLVVLFFRPNLWNQLFVKIKQYFIIIGIYLNVVKKIS